MSKIKLLYDASIVQRLDFDYTYRSGIFFVAYNLLVELMKNDNFDVELYCDLQFKYFLEETIKKHEEFKNCKIITYSKYDKIIKYLTKLKYENKKDKRFLIFRPLIKMSLNIFLKLAQRENISPSMFDEFDVYLSPKDAAPDFIQNNNKIKKCIVLHDIIPLKAENHTNIKIDWFNKLVNSLNKNDTYFANSEYTKQDILNYFEFLSPEQLTILPLSTGHPYKPESQEKVSMIKNKYNIPAGKKYIFSLCTLEPRKNIPFAIKNFVEFIKKHNIDNLVYALGGNYKSKLDEILQKLSPDYNKYKDKILYLGYVDDNDMSALYSGAELFLFPSLYEGFGIPPLEAMQCGCPVITSNVTSLPEVVADAGIQINPKSDEELIAALEKLYFNPDIRQNYKIKGLERAKLFSYKKCVDIIYDIIKRDLG